MPATRARRPLPALALLLAAGSVQAACPLEETLVEGVVASSADGQPIAAASVSAGWDERAAGRMSLVRESAADGRFALRIAFDTYSGRTFTGRDVCDGRLQSLDLRVEADGFRAEARTLSRAELAQPLRIELRPGP
jgi:hypothetical protein